MHPKELRQVPSSIAPEIEAYSHMDFEDTAFSYIAPETVADFNLNTETAIITNGIMVISEVLNS